MTRARTGARRHAALRQRRLPAVLLGLAASCAASLPPTAPVGSPDVEARISYFEEQVRADPRHWPGMAHLGAAYLDRARETHDLGALRQARYWLGRSLEIQPGFEALRSMTALHNFSHLFEQALEWAERAAAAAVDPEVMVPARVEALLGLGRTDEAGQLLETRSARDDDFFLASARSQWLVAEGRTDEALASLARAREHARAARADDLVVWTEVRSAGVLLDAGRASEARPHLAAAERLAPGDVFLAIHQAEADEAEGRDERALRRYEDVLAFRDDPTVHARAFVLYRKLGREAQAERHFAAAESGLRAVLDAGEVFTLAALADLYLDADRRPEEALALAERNLAFERDAASLALVERARQRVARSSGG